MGIREQRSGTSSDRAGIVSVDPSAIAGGPGPVATAGTSGDDVLIGDDEVDDLLEGLGGNDTLDGLGGVDTTDGGTGDDIHYVDSASDIVIERDGEGHDRVIATGDSFNLANDVYVEELWAAAGTTDTILHGNDHDNYIQGNDGDNILLGLGGEDTLVGGGGENRLDGGGGADVMQGGSSPDRYYVDDPGDQIIETYAGLGTDLVVAQVDYALAPGVRIEYFYADDFVHGQDPIDLTGNEFDQNLIGNQGDNILDGGAGADRMEGRDGDDIYYVDNANDFIIEFANNPSFDVVYTSVSYALPVQTNPNVGSEPQIEELRAIDPASTVPINLTGNKYDQSLFGNDGDNIIDGGAGSDIMTGYDGDDSYYVNSLTDQVIEQPGEGNDRIYSGAANYTLGAGQEVETLSTANDAGTGFVNLTGNERANTLIGNAGNNTLDGKGGNDTLNGLGGINQLIGGTGDDRYIVGAGTDTIVENAGEGFDRVLTSASYVLAANVSIEMFTTANNIATTAIDLTGNNLAQHIYGNFGANRLDGGGGSDVLSGFEGNDFFYVRSSADRVIEVLGEGNDRIFAAVSFALEANSAVEMITTIDNLAATAINLAGNNLTQFIYGNAGANTLDGGGGGDVMVGLEGNDFFYIRNAADRVVEAAGGGSDRVFAATSFTLEAGSAVELLTTVDNLAGTAINLTGNALRQFLYGNAGVNTLDGKSGADVMTGFGGADSFAFTSALGGGNIARITDFAPGADKIALDNAVFTGLGAGALNPNAFYAGAAAHDADDRIVYNQATGALYYDADGNGGGAAVQFATLDTHPVIAASDFTVI